VKTKKLEESAAMRLLSLVWAKANTSTSHSWERLNHSMRAALELAIGSGMEFAKDDFAAFDREFRTQYWMGDTSEWAYRLAVAVGNRSAIVAYEQRKNRGPFIAYDVKFPYLNDSGFTHGNVGTRSRERLVVGAEFPWKGEQVTVTSMPHGDGPLVACSYAPTPGAQHHRKILHRYKITATDIIEDRKRRNLLDRLQDEVPEAERKALLAELGNPANKTALLGVPMARVERAAKKFLKAKANAARGPGE